MPLPDEVITKAELMRLMKRFIDDKNRGISINLFSELAGIDYSLIYDVFNNMSVPLSEYVQRRVSKAYKAWAAGEVAVMENPDRTRFVQYRREPKPRFHRSQRLKVVNGKIQLDIGIKNRADYSQPSLEETLNGESYGRHP